MTGEPPAWRLQAWRTLVKLGVLSSNPTLHDISTSERIVEYGWILRNLDLEPGAGTVLDVGCNQTYFAQMVATLGYDVTGIDFGEPTVSHPRFRYVMGSPERPMGDLGDEEFDRVLVISVIEHIGVDGSDPVDLEADREAFRSFADRVKPGGRLLVTVPIGKGVTGAWRAYSPERMRELGGDLKLVREEYFAETAPRIWEPVAEAAAAAVRYGPDSGRTRACGCFVFEKP